MVSMYSYFRSTLFRADPERVHTLALSLMHLVGALPPLGTALRAWFATPDCPVQAFGLTFPNPIGLAAGYDKDGVAWRGLACLGFGHIEVGTVTLRPQPGNPRPRLFRLEEDEALINRLGFPGKGAEFLVQRLQAARPKGLVLGVNLGKNWYTPLERAYLDYLALMEIFAPLADYLVINLSCPNTEGLRRLQARQALEDLLSGVVKQRQEQQISLERRVPVLVKLAPDLNSSELDDALKVILNLGIDGVIATNTTISRESLISPSAREAGGLSGAPLRERSTQMVRQIHQRTSGQLPIIGVGGVMNADDAKDKLEAGAVLVQIYTGLVYAGPGLVKQVMQRLKG